MLFSRKLIVFSLIAFPVLELDHLDYFRRLMPYVDFMGCVEYQIMDIRQEHLSSNTVSLSRMAQEYGDITISNRETTRFRGELYICRVVAYERAIQGWSWYFCPDRFLWAVLYACTEGGNSSGEQLLLVRGESL